MATKHKIRHKLTKATQTVADEDYRKGAFHNWEVIETITDENPPTKPITELVTKSDGKKAD